MKILKEGDKGTGRCSACDKEVSLRYEYWSYRSPFPESESEDVLLGICCECGRPVYIPEQSHPVFWFSLERKTEPIEVRVPRHLRDILHLIAARYKASKDLFPAALLRFYIGEFVRDQSFARLVLKLAESDLAKGAKDARISFRMQLSYYFDFMLGLYRAKTENQSLVVRGLIIAAMKDEFEDLSLHRKRVIRGIAAAVT